MFKVNTKLVQLQDKKEMSSLFYAVFKENIELAQLLIKNGINVNLQDSKGWSPFNWAIYKENLELAQLLIKNGAFVNVQTKVGVSFCTMLYIKKELNWPCF